MVVIVCGDAVREMLFEIWLSGYRIVFFPEPNPNSSQLKKEADAIDVVAVVFYQLPLPLGQKIQTLINDLRSPAMPLHVFGEDDPIHDLGVRLQVAKKLFQNRPPVSN